MKHQEENSARCHRFDAALTDIAAGADASPALRAHLTECPACSARFTAEQQLFEAIDSGLHTAVNTDVPAHLIASVRLRIANQTAPKRWFVPALAPLSAALVIGLLLIYEFHPFTAQRTAQPDPLDSASAERSQTMPRLIAPPQASSPNSLLPRGLSPRSATFRAKSDNASPQVLVPHGQELDQELLLATYAQSWRTRNHPPLILAEASQSLSQVDIAPIQIDLLNVQSMADSELR